LAWDEVKVETVVHCFRHVGIGAAVPDNDLNEWDEIVEDLEMPDGMDINLGEDVQTWDLLEGPHHAQVEVEEEPESDDEEVLEPPSLTEVLNAAVVIERYLDFHQSDQRMEALRKAMFFVTKETVALTRTLSKQAKLTNFFSSK
jgi:hypothetical protein